ncbi:chaperone activator, putative [Cryptococcus deneoformans JEC21]|uniref:Chaperone activator, putative n=1 Tax=Cryptococcus deneoformans (strain JEC21 / ATCC MYA-565) TaxID=214684 RepID=Q5KPG4_CRYD1|nr:chaperone activator, putative [Cryptococcus neoformans var. neoformans JEC21]AAW40882.1 chaperone activator, putative [Cryptococcus neoformans var. neoformans JEC21]
MEPKPLTAYQQTYHWRNKNCAPFAYDWIKQSLPGLKVDDGQQSAEISSVTSVSGDCDLGQRKGKLLTIYDLEVQASWIGKTKDGNEVKGTLKIPEVSHEAIDGVSDYVYEFSITGGSSSASEELLFYIRKSFPPLLSDKFNSFRPALLAAHGSATADAASAPDSGASTPAAYTPAPPTKGADEPINEEQKKEKKSVGATVTVEVKADLQASADDLWGLLTDENKIPMWSRSAAKLSLKAGSPYELFGGNVRGKVITADPPKKLVQTWQVKSPSWPSEHYGTMTLSLSQGSDTTAATFTLDGVPAGTQADVEKALNSFYIQGLKQMGLGTFL